MFTDLKDSAVSKTISKTSGFYVKMRPKTATVTASFHESLTNLVETMSKLVLFPVIHVYNKLTYFIF